MLTSKQVEFDIFNLLKGSGLARAVNGEVYYEGDRPRDSVSEDIIIIFIAGMSTEIERGNVYLHIYVPDVKPYKNGVPSARHARLKQLSEIAAEWFATLNSAGTPYKFDIDPMISVAVDDDTQQHFILVPLHYEYYNQH